MFLNRLYAAFDVDNNKQIDFRYVAAIAWELETPARSNDRNV
jgi:hypothetical protein